MAIKRSERKEAWMRILVGIISGIVLGVWRYLIYVFVVINWFIAVFSGKRNEEMARLCEIWNTQTYIFLKYITFVTNERPFPFEKLSKSISKFRK